MYECLGEQQSLVEPNVPVEALIATVETWKMIIKDQCMKDYVFQLVDSNKIHIIYWVFETGRGRDDICEDFD